VLKHFATSSNSDRIMRAIILNPSTPGTIIAPLALSAPEHLLETILDNRTRIINSPQILDNVRKNRAASSEILRLVQEIEIEFLGSKRKEYTVGETTEDSSTETSTAGLESEIPPEDLSLEGLPLDGEQREAAITNQLAALPVREKIRYALFGNREIRAVLVRDTNKEVARNVLHSPKLTENEVESIAAMRSVAEDILREIGTSREWTKSYGVVHNLVKNPKTPPGVSQRLMIRLRSSDLTLLSRDRSISDAVRYNATRMLKQRTSAKA
jgi:hypothetical protein